jgi:hypothetical protein
MPATPQTPVVTQFGFSTRLGNIANIGDGDEATFWAPYPDVFASYTQAILFDDGITLNVGVAFPCLQFDFGESVRIPIFRPKTETRAALGPCWLIASDVPATDISSVIQPGDVYAGQFSLAQMNGNASLFTLANTIDIRKRFWRFLQRVQPPPV